MSKNNGKTGARAESSPGGKVDCSAIERRLGTSLGPLLDAFSLGLDDEQAAELAEVSVHEVRELRSILGDVGSSLGLAFKKPVCRNDEQSENK